MQTFLIVFLLFFLPFLVFPFGSSPFEIPKVILAETIIGVLLVLEISKTKFLPLTWRNYQKYWPFGAVVTLGLIHLIFFKTDTTFFGNSFRLQGLFLLWLLLALSVVSSRFNLNEIPKWVYSLALSLLFISSLIVGTNLEGRAIGTLGEPNALAYFSVFLWPFVFFKFEKKAFKIPGLLLPAMIILLSGSRSGLLAFAIQLMFIFLIKVVKFSPALSLAISLLILGISYFLPILQTGGMFENRAMVWQAAIYAGLQNPIFGGGFGNLESIIHQSAKSIGSYVQFQYVDSGHNILFDWWAQGGILGLLVLVYLLVKTFRSFTKQAKILEIMVFLGLLTALSFNPASIVGLIGFWWLIGQGFSLEDN